MAWRWSAVFVIKCSVFNLQNSFTLLTNNTVSCKGLWATVCTHDLMLWQRLLFAHSLPNHSVTDKMAAHTSFSVINCYQCFLSMTATAENPVLHKHVVTKGNRTFPPLSDKLSQT